MLTEAWAGSEAFCPSCGHLRLSRFSNNSPVADLYCGECKEEFELKSQKANFGARITDGAYGTMCARLEMSNNPNLMLMNYNTETGVRNLVVVPKHFFVKEIIEKRKPLGSHARRAGWVGCNILLSRIPEFGKIFVVRNGQVFDPKSVCEQWRRTLFLRTATDAARGWLLNVLWCVERIGETNFVLDDVYKFERRLGEIYPDNQHVREKIRQQLQVLRDRGLIEFLGRGRYRLVKP